jgi:hypothetical protein
MIFLGRLKSRGYRCLGDPAYALRDVLCGLSDTVGRQSFGFRLPGRFIIDSTDGGPGRIHAF